MQERRISWGDLWRAEPTRISFMLRSVYDLLPTPANLPTGVMRGQNCALHARGIVLAAHTQLLPRCLEQVQVEAGPGANSDEHSSKRGCGPSQ